MLILDEMALFVAVARAGSFTQAAQSLEMPKSTLSARISRLEQRMGLPLLKRSTRKVELTKAGRLYFNRADALVSEAGLLHEQLGHLLREPQGLLRLSVPVDFAHEFIAPYLGEFCERFPLIRLSFDVTPRKVNLISERFDVAIRAGKQPDSGLVQRLLAMFSGGLYAPRLPMWRGTASRWSLPIRPGTSAFAFHQVLMMCGSCATRMKWPPRQTAIRPMTQRLTATRPARNHAASA